jgi:hypothetical protein
LLRATTSETKNDKITVAVAVTRTISSVFLSAEPTSPYWAKKR